MNPKLFKRTWGFPKNWAFIGLMLVGISFFSSSCQKATTTDLIPDSCRGLVKLDLPKLIPKLLANRMVIDSINHLAGLPLDKMGLNFFQPAYLYQNKNSSDFLVIMGINNSSKFSEVISQKFNTQPIEKQDEFSTLWAGSWQLIWNDKFLIGKKVDPLLGKPEWDPNWKSYFIPTEDKNRTFPLDETTDMAWFWHVEEEFLGGVIPILEAKISGTGTWNHPNLSIKTEIEEHQYLALLRPFSLDLPSNQPLQAVIWPALESILLQIESYGGNPYKNEMNPKILDLIKKMDHPFECLLVGNQTDDLLKAIQVKTRYSDENNAISLEKEINIMLPNSFLDQYSINRKGGEVSLFHQTSQAVFSENTPAKPSINNLLLGIFQKDSSMQTQVKLQLAKPGRYNLSIEALHPERISSQDFIRQILSLQPETIMSQFLPHADEQIP